MKLIKAETWARRYFDKEDRPDLRTVRGWVRDGYVPGREVGPKLVYVDEDAWLAQQTGDPLADKVLRNTSRR